jgi:membrane protein implicated in regulation of membrane protease activity
MLWWIWLSIGLILFLAEIFLPLDLFLFFIGLAFVFTGLISYFELLNEPSYYFVIAGLLSIIFLITIRPILKKMFIRNVKNVSDIIGEDVELVEDILSSQTGFGLMRGSSWKVLNKTSETLIKGKTYKVSSFDSLTLIIE